MTIDTKAILTRASEAKALADKASQGPRRVDPCALIPRLAADVRELVGGVGILQVDLEAQEKINLRDHERAEKAEARVKELEAEVGSLTEQRQEARLFAGDRFVESLVNARQCAEAEARLAVAVEALTSIAISSHDYDMVETARAALAKIREGKA